MHPDPDLDPVERRALATEPGTPVALTTDGVHRLLAHPAYRESLGRPATARHYRRRLPDGSGLHLVLDAEGGALHRDRRDPHGGLSGLWRHLTADAGREATSLAAAAAALFLRVGSRPPAPRGREAAARGGAPHAPGAPEGGSDGPSTPGGGSSATAPR